MNYEVLSKNSDSHPCIGDHGVRCHVTPPTHPPPFPPSHLLVSHLGVLSVDFTFRLDKAIVRVIC